MKFIKKNISADYDPNPTYDYGVDLDTTLNENEFALQGLDWDGWTSKEIETIINNSKKLKINEEYNYEVEESYFFMIVKKDKVNMWAKGSRTPDITWTFEKFISFMEDFKSFLKQNKK